MLAVVMLNDPKIGGGPGRVVEVTADPIGAVLQRYTDRDGARSDRLRIWLAWEGCRPGDFASVKLKLGTGRVQEVSPR